jgi:pimeloyl-ACP methyl ester carboxylesterase
MSAPKPLFVLIHSPLVGSLTWQLVAAEFRERGYKAVTPSLTRATEGGPPYWHAFAEAVKASLSTQPLDSPLVLVGHSGAGGLLPAVARATQQPVATYVFVDAPIPRDGGSLFDLFDDKKAVSAVRGLARDGKLPRWSEWFPEEALAGILPDEALRRAFLSELRPTPLSVYEEPLPVVTEWRDASCTYLHFSEAYDSVAEKVMGLPGWRYRKLEGGHLHMLVDPAGVADALVDLVSGTPNSTAAGRDG